MHPSGTGLLVAERGSGHLLAVQPVIVGRKRFPMVSIGVWWTTPQGEHAPDGRRSCMVHASELPALIQALKTIFIASKDPEPFKPAAQSFQDRALLAIANGLNPHDLHGELWPKELANPRRLTELGKALRRAGLLVPGAWGLTELGRERAATLQDTKEEAGKEISNSQEIPAIKPSK